jgi:nitroreductase
LVRIVDAGIKAPSGKNAQTTEFIIVDDRDIIYGIALIAGKPFIKTARAVIACVVRPEPVYHGLSFEAEDCAASVENMLLAITALGYSSVWIDGNIRLDGKAAKIGSLLRIPPPRYVRVILPLGVPSETQTQAEKKPTRERAFFNSYGGDENHGKRL